METQGRPRQTIPRLAWVIVAVGSAVPWLEGAWIKLVLDVQGLPTWPWSAFLSPQKLISLVPITVWLSLPFFVLAYAAYRLLPQAFAGLETRRARQIFFVAGLVMGVIGQLYVFGPIFDSFEFSKLLTPMWLGYVPHMLVGLGVGYVVGRWVGQRKGSA